MSKQFILTQRLFRVLGTETHILESPLWEAESSLVELSSLTNKLGSETERKERDMQRNKQTSRMNPDNQGSDPAAGRCFSHTSTS